MREVCCVYRGNPAKAAVELMRFVAVNDTTFLFFVGKQASSTHNTGTGEAA